MAQAQSVGRPKALLSELSDDWPAKILALYEQGASDVEIKAEIYKMRGSFSNDLFDRWLEEEPEFSKTIKIGRLLSHAYWERSGRVSLTNKDFSYTGWYMNMKNRFGWRDKQEIEHQGDIGIHQMSDEQLDMRLKALISATTPENTTD